MTAREILKLATLFQGAAMGLCLDDIQAEFEVSRSTAERMRNDVRYLFPDLKALPLREGDQRQYWTLPRCSLELLNATPDELAHLANAVAFFRDQNRTDAAEALENIAGKLRAAMGPGPRLNAIDSDLEILMQAEGLATRPGPRVKLDPDILAALRHAILAPVKIRIHYRSVGTGGISWHKVCPYGFLYGNWPYLVAFSRNPEILDYRTYRLSNILAIEATDEMFERDPAFSLDAYARRSFGVFQEEPFDVVWKFTPHAAVDASQYVFHPDQTTETLADGSLIVRFWAGGAREMAWHLYTWGNEVEVLEPEGFWGIDADQTSGPSG